MTGKPRTASWVDGKALYDVVPVLDGFIEIIGRNLV